MVALFDCRSGVELISGARASVDGVPRLGSATGVGADFSGTRNLRWAHLPAFALTGPMTIFIYCDVDALTNYGGLIAKQGSTTTYAPYEIRIGGSGPTDSQMWFGRASSSAIFAERSSGGSLVAAASLGNRIFFTDSDGTLAANTRNVIVNGVKTLLAAGEAGSATGAAIADNGADVWI